MHGILFLLPLWRLLSRIIQFSVGVFELQNFEITFGLRLSISHETKVPTLPEAILREALAQWTFNNRWSAESARSTSLPNGIKEPRPLQRPLPLPPSSRVQTASYVRCIMHRFVLNSQLRTLRRNKFTPPILFALIRENCNSKLRCLLA